MGETVSLKDGLNDKWQRELRLAQERVKIAEYNLGRIASVYSEQLNFDQALRDYLFES